MSATATPVFKDRIQLPFHFDAAKIYEEFKALQRNQFEYYDVVPMRSPAHLVDRSIAFPPPAEDYADGTWCDWLNNIELESSPYTKSIVEQFQKHATVNLVRLLRLAPGAVVKEHTDPTLGIEIERSMVRLTIPVYNAPGVEFYLNDSLLTMKPGECWYLRLTDPHRIINASSEERVNLTIDIIPNDWFRAQLEKHQ
ncbi:aspartyl/asparaginyl beta-hydroxylase domain-containing protein [Gilvibacter sediminis]|uniref:aspartyl/asparaginyl beta-hydroxylase domain-containing protein n=1 Tax=Gilvibacter sediminis TaxID=379071 RepID=UPI00234FFCDC|nr:aspartyl/asparaginyl beta-hydroxylase domain-containing protein [Gilvibacter sediminis]MDC7998004.1 aspartyl/asparaginyl beta-hydroxylase domain-containing protein [Gilvibacter sediminis]